MGYTVSNPLSGNSNAKPNPRSVGALRYVPRRFQDSRRHCRFARKTIAETEIKMDLEHNHGLGWYGLG